MGLEAEVAVTDETLTRHLRAVPGRLDRFVMGSSESMVQGMTFRGIILVSQESWFPDRSIQKLENSG